MTTASEKIWPATSASVVPLAELLAQGELLVVPTETVYAIALDIRHPEAKRKLALIKGWKSEGEMPEGSRWVMHLGGGEELGNYLVHQPAGLLGRMIKRCWPGPVTLDIELLSDDILKINEYVGGRVGEIVAWEGAGKEKGWASFRVPDHWLTRELLEVVGRRGIPIAMVAATAGRPHNGDVNYPDITLSLPEIITDNVAVIWDAGATRFHKPSTWVRVEGDKVRILRSGVFDERTVKRLAQLNLLFVCTGNTCRSPMAWAIARKLLAERLGVEASKLGEKGVMVNSAGIHAYGGMPATPEAVEAVEGIGAELKNHKSQMITAELLRRADVIFTMTDAQREELVHLFPAIAEKTIRIDPSDDVDDPIGGSAALYRQVAERLLKVLSTRINEIQL